MHRTLAAILAFHALAAPLPGQDEAALRSWFEGKSVAVKIAMAAAEEGVDVYPGTAAPLDYPELAKRLKRRGTAIQRGQRAMVTKIRVKGKLIEFQLDGGGYGTMGDQTDPTVSVPSAPKTKREENLERDVKTENDPAAKRRMQEELDGLRAARAREDRRNEAIATDATERKRDYLQQRRLQGGSRFNLRYPDGVPSPALTVGSVRTALAAYVDFAEASAAPSPGGDSAAGPPPAGPLALRKGLSIEEAEQLLGAPTQRKQQMEGSLTVSNRTYDTREGRVEADFVEGVLVRFTITSR